MRNVIFSLKKIIFYACWALFFAISSVKADFSGTVTRDYGGAMSIARSIALVRAEAQMQSHSLLLRYLARDPVMQQIKTVTPTFSPPDIHGLVYSLYDFSFDYMVDPMTQTITGSVKPVPRFEDLRQAVLLSLPDRTLMERYGALLDCQKTTVYALNRLLEMNANNQPEKPCLPDNGAATGGFLAHEESRQNSFKQAPRQLDTTPHKAPRQSSPQQDTPQGRACAVIRPQEIQTSEQGSNHSIHRPAPNRQDTQSVQGTQDSQDRAPKLATTKPAETTANRLTDESSGRAAGASPEAQAGTQADTSGATPRATPIGTAETAKVPVTARSTAAEARPSIHALSDTLMALQDYQALLRQYDKGWSRPETLHAKLTGLENMAPDNALVQGALAEVLLQLEKPQQAQYHSERALAITRKYAYLHDTHGQILLKLNLPALATDAFTNALALDIHNPLFYEHRGTSHLMRNNLPAMCQDFDKACVLGLCSGSQWAHEHHMCGADAPQEDTPVQPAFNGSSNGLSNGLSTDEPGQTKESRAQR